MIIRTNKTIPGSCLCLTLMASESRGKGMKTPYPIFKSGRRSRACEVMGIDYNL